MGVKDLSITIFMTNQCNLKCKYCYERNISKENMTGEISAENILFTIDFMKRIGQRHSVDNFFVTFHGGEPLLHFDGVKRFVKCIEQDEFFAKKEVTFGMTSNGVLLSDEMAKFIGKYIDDFSLSIDGTREIHDSMRIDANGYGSFEAVKNAAKKILKVKSDTKARMTINSNSIGEFDNCLRAVIDMGFHNIVPVIDLWDQGWNETNVQLIEKYNDALLSREMDDIIVEPFINKEIKKKKCSGGENNYCITTDGDIYPCVVCVGDDKYRYGNVSGEIDMKTVQFVEECKKILIDECKGCTNYSYCNGVRCIFLNEKYSGKIDKVIPMACFLEQLKFR